MPSCQKLVYMKISIVTICYNAVGIIEDTILSVINQTYSDKEYIIIDGASSDGTAELIRKYENKTSCQVSEPDGGIYDAMNKGIKAATGDYVIFMNAGDKFSDSTALERIAPYLDGEATVVAGKWNKCYSDGSKKTSSPKNINSLSTDMPVCHQACFISLAYHKKHLFDSSLSYSADYDFFYKAWRSGAKFIMIDEIVADFTADHGASSDNVAPSVMERAKSWEGEDGLTFRKLSLQYQVARITAVKALKRMLNH